jgi:hypothetical protein
LSGGLFGEIPGDASALSYPARACRERDDDARTQAGRGGQWVPGIASPTAEVATDEVGAHRLGRPACLRDQLADTRAELHLVDARAGNDARERDERRSRLRLGPE